MTSMMTGGMFNAFAFAGAGYLFKKFGSGNYEEETKRHNLAIENLNRAKERWSENEIKQRDKIQRLRTELSDANKDIYETNQALDLLRTVEFQGRTFKREPRLSDYYEPSPEMQQYQLIMEGIMGVGIGWVGYKTYGYFTREKRT